jgi:hypothetical protein
MRKHFTTLISSKIKAVKKAHPNQISEFRIEVDPLPSRYNKADEAFHKIANNMLKQELGGSSLIQTVVTKDSKESQQIQLADFLLGAVMSAFQGKVTSDRKKDMANHIASYLGWDSLKHDTWNNERKFNIWYFHDVRNEMREIQTQTVKLIYPLPNKPNPKFG